MNSKKKSRKRQFSEKEIDKVVESEAEDDSGWGKPVHLRRAKPGALSLPAKLAARAGNLGRRS